MKKYTIEFEICLGMSHSGAEFTDGKAVVELSDEEVKQLVDLIRQTGSTDVYGMDLETVNPGLYEKLDTACYDATCFAEQLYWLEEAFHTPECFDPSQLLDKAESEFGFTFEYNENDYTDDDGGIDEDRIEEDRLEAFSDYLDELTIGMDDAEKFDFYTNKLGIEADPECSDYEVLVPQEIINMAQLEE